MAKKRSVKGSRWLGWLIVGIGVTPVVLTGLATALGVIPWRIPTPAGLLWPSELPEPLDLPWVSGGFGWGFVLVLVGFTAMTFWLERGRERRIEPLALVAICLAVLGHAEAIHGAQAMAFSGAWPVNLLDVGIWILLAAAGVAVLAWVRILVSKIPVRGRILATCALLCSLGSAWFVHTFLVDCWESPTSEDGIELAVARYSSPDRPYWDYPASVVLVRADGTISPDSIVELARNMKQRDGIPDEQISVRADRRTSWAAVRQALERVQEAGIWKLSFVTRWEEPEATTRISAYLPRRVGVHVEGAEPPPPPYGLRVSSDDPLMFEGEPLENPDALHERMEQLSRQGRGDRLLRIEADEEARWGDVVVALSAARRSFELVDLGPFSLAY